MAKEDPTGGRGLRPVHFLDELYVVSLRHCEAKGENMRYKSAKGILLEIGEDEQASSETRLKAVEMLAGAEKLPELKGYKSGSRENLLLRLASDSSQPAKDRLRAVRQLLDDESSPTKVKAACEPAPGVDALPVSEASKGK